MQNILLNSRTGKGSKGVRVDRVDHKRDASYVCLSHLLGRSQISRKSSKIRLIRYSLTILVERYPHTQSYLRLYNSAPSVLKPSLRVLTPTGADILNCCVSVPPAVISLFDIACICNCCVWKDQLDPHILPEWYDPETDLRNSHLEVHTLNTINTVESRQDLYETRLVWCCTRCQGDFQAVSVVGGV